MTDLHSSHGGTNTKAPSTINTCTHLVIVAERSAERTPGCRLGAPVPPVPRDGAVGAHGLGGRLRRLFRFHEVPGRGHAAAACPSLVFLFCFFAHDSLVSEVALLGWGWLRWLVVLFGRCSSLGWSGVVEGGRQARHRFVTAGLLGRVSCFEVVPTRDKGVGPASYYLGGQLACRRLSFRPGCEQHQSPGHEYLATRNPQQV